MRYHNIDDTNLWPSTFVLMDPNHAYLIWLSCYHFRFAFNWILRKLLDPVLGVRNWFSCIRQLVVALPLVVDLVLGVHNFLSCIRQLLVALPFVDFDRWRGQISSHDQGWKMQAVMCNMIRVLSIAKLKLNLRACLDIRLTHQSPNLWKFFFSPPPRCSTWEGVGFI